MADQELTVCAACKRHIRTSCVRCPFCARAAAPVHVLHLTAAVLVAGCTPPPQDTIVPMGAPPEAPASVQTVAAPPSASASADSELVIAPPAESESQATPDVVPFADPLDAGVPDRGVVAVYGPPPPRTQAPVYGPPPRVNVPAYGPPPQPQARSAQDVRRVFMAARPRFKQCWQPAAGPDASVGRVSLRVTIAPSGRVSAAEIKDSNLTAAADRCILAEAKRMQFPAAQTETVVMFPLAFTP